MKELKQAVVGLVGALRKLLGEGGRMQESLWQVSEAFPHLLEHWELLTSR